MVRLICSLGQKGQKGQKGVLLSISNPHGSLLLTFGAKGGVVVYF